MLKYKNTLTQLGNGSFIHLELDKFMEFYFELSNGLQVFPEEADKILGLISEGDGWVSELGRYSEDGRKVTVGIDELNERVKQLMDISGKNIPLCEGEDIKDFVLLTFSTLDLDDILPGGMLSYMGEWTSKRVSSVRARLESNLISGKIERSDWVELTSLTSSFYREIRKVFHTHKMLFNEIKHISNIFRYKKIRYVNGEYNYKLVSSVFKKELGRDVKYTIVPVARMVGWLQSQESTGEHKEIISSLEHGGVFEVRVAGLYKALGYEVTLTPSTGDFGIDILAKSNNGIIGIQCKNYAGNVGVDAVMQAHSGAVYYQCKSSAVVAPNGFTEAAYEMANKLGVELLVLCE